MHKYTKPLAFLHKYTKQQQFKYCFIEIYLHRGSVSHPFGKPKAFLSISGKRINSACSLSSISLFGDIMPRKYLIMQRVKLVFVKGYSSSHDFYIKKRPAHLSIVERLGGFLRCKDK